MAHSAAHDHPLQDFTVAAQDDWPLLPDMHHLLKASSPVLARRLWSLMACAAANVVPPPASKPDSSLQDELGALLEAARNFRIGQSHLHERMWTSPRPLWSGETGAKLAASSSDSAQGFLLLLASSATSQALLFKHGAPLVVQAGLKGRAMSERPHLALILCTAQPVGGAIAISGFVQPVLSAHCLMPVNTPFERDVLRLLIDLQEKLDCFGIDCALTRPYDGEREAFATNLLLGFGRAGQRQHVLRIDLNPQCDRPERQFADTSSFTPSPARLNDGSFITWMEERIGQALSHDPCWWRPQPVDLGGNR